jgi:hypothetical protein
LSSRSCAAMPQPHQWIHHERQSEADSMTRRRRFGAEHSHTHHEEHHEQDLPQPPAPRRSRLIAADSDRHGQLHALCGRQLCHLSLSPCAAGVECNTRGRWLYIAELSSSLTMTVRGKGRRRIGLDKRKRVRVTNFPAIAAAREAD